MRYGVLSDIHGNLYALEAALAVLRREQVDAYLCAGDLVGYGPRPNECVELIASLGAVCVAGNHELMALGQLSEDGCIPLAQHTLRWTRRVLREDTWTYLARLPLRAEVAERVVLTHASLDDPRQYVLRPRQAAEQLDRLAVAYPTADTLILGHTHLAWAYARRTGTLPIPPHGTVELAGQERHLLNPGSVGQSRSREREPHARIMLLDLDQRHATFHTVAYDVAACREDLRRQGLPTNAYHLHPTPLSGPTNRVRRLAKRALALAVRRRAAHPG